MIISQSWEDNSWIITLDFENVSLENVDFPVYISGNFNRWNTNFNKNSEDYIVSKPGENGENYFHSYTIEVPNDWNFIEFRLLTEKGFMDINDYKHLFKENTSFMSNSYGSTNIVVYNEH